MTRSKVKSPPGSGRLVGVAVLVMPMAGRTSVTSTSAESSSPTGVPSSSVPPAVTVSVTMSPALPAVKASKVQA